MMIIRLSSPRPHPFRLHRSRVITPQVTVCYCLNGSLPRWAQQIQVRAGEWFAFHAVRPGGLLKFASRQSPPKIKILF